MIGVVQPPFVNKRLVHLGRPLYAGDKNRARRRLFNDKPTFMSSTDSEPPNLDWISPSDVAIELPFDDRITKENLTVARSVAAELESTLSRVSGTFDLRKDGWKIFVLYYASRILGALGGEIALRVHGFGREAEFLDRALYEYYTKMLYYSTLRDQASKALQSVPKQYIKLVEKLRMDPRRFLDEDQMKAIESAVDYNGDADFKDMRERLIRDTRFTRQTDRASVLFYLKESRNRWNVDWVAPSQVVHGSIMDVVAAMKLDGDKMTVSGELSSHRPRPNGQLLDACQFAIFTVAHVEGAFGLAEHSGRPALSQRLAAAFADSKAADGG